MSAHQHRALSIVAIVVAGALPWQISFNMLPIPSFVNELVCVLGWGMLALTLGLKPVGTGLSRGLLAVSASLLLLALVPGLQLLRGQTQLFVIYLQWLYFLVAAALAIWLGYCLAASEGAEKSLDIWAWCWLGGCFLGLLTELSQYLMLNISWYWVSPLNDAGRMFGNIRQPNHMATLLALGLPCVAWLMGRDRLGKVSAAAMAMAIAVGVAMTASRTGFLLLGGMAVVFLIDRKTRSVAMVLAGAAVFSWIVLFLLDVYHFRPYYGSARMLNLANAENLTSLSGSRLELWRDTLVMIAQHPWLGTGLGQFEFYRLTSDLPSQIKSLFTNAHNLPLHLAAELGLPTCMAVLSLWAYAGWREWANARTPIGRFAVLSVACVAIHSLFEFPLWYAFILLPTGFFVGLACGAGRDKALSSATPAESTALTRVTQAAGAFVFLGALVAVPHYLALAAIYAPGGDRDSVGSRMETANKAYLYGHLVMFGLLTSLNFEMISQSPRLLEEYSKNARFFMDERYMARYALALAENGRDAEAGRLVRSLQVRASPHLNELRTYAERQQTQGGKTVLTYMASKQLPVANASDFH